MTQGQYNIYKADEGKFIYRKSDDFLFGEGICLGEGDSIDNYYEREYTEEEKELHQRLIHSLKKASQKKDY